MHSDTRVLGRASLLALLFVLGCSSEEGGAGQPTSSIAMGGSTSSGGSASSTGGRSNPTGGVASSSAAEPAPLTGITAAHNAVRAQAMPAPAAPLIPLTWDVLVAAAAQQWADNCMFKHSQGKYGENIYATSGGADAQKVVASWASEFPNYNYANNSCASNKTCGNYTQIVWGKSLRLGCAAKQCIQNSPFGNGSWEFWVCNYDPPGNYVGQKPY